MTARELRQKFLQFFDSKGHSQYPSGLLIPYDVTGRLDESLLFNGAGMVQFKPFFRGVATPPNRRLTTAQKCVRTGDIDEVGDLTHNTFFEMLGNFSFGDYFKKEAIGFSWEFVTSPEWLGLDPKRVAYTVFEEDIEVYEFWATHLKTVDIEPSSRIFRLGEDSNYWPAGAFTNGPPGPCGTNSEMFYWTSNDVPPPSGTYTREEFVRDEADGKWLEFWNDVFIQFEWKGHLKNPARPSDGYVKEAIDPLPFQSVDTGMGLERSSVVIGGFKSNYDTDLFAPIIRKIEEISKGKVKYGGTLDLKDTAVRVISDHIRTACFCIADGVLPSNTGRGYVLRRLIRRAVLKGQRALGFEEPFFARVYEGVVEAVGDHYLELTERRDVILETLHNEELLFRRTLSAGYSILQEELDKLKAKVLPGDLAFKLYDTYGFPLEVTRELVGERGLTVDEDGYEKALLEAQTRSRASTERETVYGGGANLNILWVEPGETPAFVGYDRSQQSSRVVLVAEPQQASPGDGNLGPFLIGLEKTPFYAESGGQVSDKGTIEIDGKKLEVEKMVKVNGQPLHLVTPAAGILGANDRQSFVEAVKGAVANAVIDAHRRANTIRNHSATHLLHAALRRVLGKHVTQAGSQVEPEHLRFDFTHGKAMSAEELTEVEKIVNEEALASLPVTIFSDIPISEAKERGAMALFGEKYGDKVRMVQMGDFSLELCGGCHVRQTSEVGLFKIISESSAASGVRRIEAITGEKAYEWVREQTQKTREAAALLKANPGDLVGAIERMLNTLKDEKRKIEKMRTQTAGSSSGAGEKVGNLELVVEKLTEGDADEAKLLADRLIDSQPLRVAVVGLLVDGKITFVCKVGPEAVKKGANAGKLVGEIAKIAGGGGGGRADFATAGGRLPEKFHEALGVAKSVLAGQIGA
jgi:alanyl-tRNA synthetase